MKSGACVPAHCTHSPATLPHSCLSQEAGTTDAEVAQAVGPMFKREVGETFLRCVKESIAHDNVVIELNGLKIAEDRTFADCAR